jgi:hypothetical protein
LQAVCFFVAGVAPRVAADPPKIACAVRGQFIAKKQNNFQKIILTLQVNILTVLQIEIPV